MGLAIVVSGGAKFRLPERVREIVAYYDYRRERPYREGVCFISANYSAFSYFNAKECLNLAPDRRNFLLLGDSHAAHLWFGMQTVYKDANILQATASSCKPFPTELSGRRYCQDLMQFIYDKYIPSHRLDAVVLSAFWSEDDLSSLRATIQRLLPYADRIYVIGPIMRYHGAFANILARSLWRDDPASIERARLAEPAQTDAYLRMQLAASGAVYVSLYEALCPGDSCPVFAAPDIPFQFDDHHLTKEGSILLAQRIMELRLIE